MGLLLFDAGGAVAGDGPHQTGFERAAGLGDEVEGAAHLGLPVVGAVVLDPLEGALELDTDGVEGGVSFLRELQHRGAEVADRLERADVDGGHGAVTTAECVRGAFIVPG